jgi:hypothetical protein
VPHIISASNLILPILLFSSLTTHGQEKKKMVITKLSEASLMATMLFPFLQKKKIVYQEKYFLNHPAGMMLLSGR